MYTNQFDNYWCRCKYQNRKLITNNQSRNPENFYVVIIFCRAYLISFYRVDKWKLDRFKLIFTVFILLVLKKTIPQNKALKLSFLELESLRVWHYQECNPPTYHRKTFFAPCPPDDATEAVARVNLIHQEAVARLKVVHFSRLNCSYWS